MISGESQAPSIAVTQASSESSLLAPTDADSPESNRHAGTDQRPSNTPVFARFKRKTLASLRRNMWSQTGRRVGIKKYIILRT